MKRAVDYFMIRTIAALLLGAVLILWPGEAILYLVITIGILFAIPGLILLIGYFVRDRAKHPGMPFPFAGIGSLLFGVVLLSAPQLFAGILIYLLGIILLLSGVEQLVTLIRARKWTTVSAAFYVVPTLILLAGILVLCNPFEAAETLFILIGATCLLYGIAEFVHWLKFSRRYDPEG